MSDKNDSDSIVDMKDPFSKLKRMIVEPKVYALVVKTNRMAILHVGVHHSLDEAFAAVKQRALSESGHKDVSKLNLDMWMWEVMPAPAVMKGFFGREFPAQFLLTKEMAIDLSDVPPSTIIEPLSTMEQAKQVYEMKNDLMKRIIDTKDLKAFEEAKTFLTKTEKEFIRAKIEPNAKNDTGKVE